MMSRKGICGKPRKKHPPKTRRNKGEAREWNSRPAGVQRAEVRRKKSHRAAVRLTIDVMTWPGDSTPSNTS